MKATIQSLLLLVFIDVVAALIAYSPYFISFIPGLCGTSKCAGFEGIYLIILNMFLVPVMIIIAVFTYRHQIQILNLPKLGIFVANIVSLVIISFSFGPVFWTVTAPFNDLIRDAKIKEFQISVTLVKENLMPVQNQNYNYIYTYEVNIINNSTKTFESMPIIIGLFANNQTASDFIHADPIVINSFERTFDIKPGVNKISNSIKLDFHKGNFIKSDDQVILNVFFNKFPYDRYYEKGKGMYHITYYAVSRLPNWPRE